MSRMRPNNDKKRTDAAEDEARKSIVQDGHRSCPLSSDLEGGNMRRNSDKKRTSVRLQIMEAPDRIVEGLSQSG
jgi:hypothetical protein